MDATLPRQPVAAAANRSTVASSIAASSTPLGWQGSSPPSTREIIVYSLLKLEFGNDCAYKRHAPDNIKLQCVVSATNLLVSQYDAVSAGQLSSYFGSANLRTRRSAIGKYRGRLRWSRFNSLCSNIIDNCEQILQDALKGVYNDEKKRLLTDICSKAIATWLGCGPIEGERLEASSIAKEFDLVRQSFKAWRLTIENGKATFWMFGESGEHAVRCVRFTESLTPEVFFLGKKVPPCSFTPASISNFDGVATLLRTVENASSCKGCSYEKYETLIESRPEGGTFTSRDGTMTAYLEESWAPDRCIRTTLCTQVVTSGSQCMHCRSFDNTLRSQLSKVNNRTEESRKYTALTYLSRDELLERTREQAAKIHNLQTQKHRLQEFRERMVFTKHNAEYEDLFKKLTAGLNRIELQTKNPTCKWEECEKTFSSTDDLLQHIDIKHIQMMQHSCMLFPAYECKWNGCKHIPFKSRKVLLSHLKNHTGRSDEMLLVHLLKDQAEALNKPPNQMRWHPTVLRWCLQQHSKSASAYESIRTSGILYLPSGRTLIRYRNFNHPQTGWHEGTLREMKKVYDKFTELKKGKQDRAHVGGLYFDEVKIKEGLIWDPKSDELIGFVDHPIASEVSCSSLSPAIATHIMQFHFRSLFSKFYYPAAYFLTKNATANEIDEMFWDGVRELYKRGFHVALACGDGAAINRKFFQEYANADGVVSSSTTNPYTMDPIFFISDPTHIVKKLRNNLHKSGTGEQSKRYFIYKNEPMVWEQIKAVFTRDSNRPLRFTPLRQEHIYLTPFTKMRSRLAFDVFHERVETEMESAEPQATVAIRQFLARARDMITFFTSHDCLYSAEEDVFKLYRQSMVWFCEWWQDRLNANGGVKSNAYKEFLSQQLFTDLVMTFNGFQGLLNWVGGINQNLADKDKWYIQPFRVNQDFLEQYFGLQRSASGCNQNMTAYRYGYSANAIAQSRVLFNNLGREAYNMPLTKSK